MNKTCRAHQNRMVCVPGEFCRKKPFCGKWSAPQSDEGTFIVHWRGNCSKPTVTAGLLIAAWPCAGLQPPRELKRNLWTFYVKRFSSGAKPQLFNPGRCVVLKQTFSRANAVIVLGVQLEEKQLLLLSLTHRGIVQSINHFFSLALFGQGLWLYFWFLWLLCTRVHRP